MVEEANTLRKMIRMKDIAKRIDVNRSTIYRWTEREQFC